MPAARAARSTGRLSSTSRLRAGSNCSTLASSRQNCECSLGAPKLCELKPASKWLITWVRASLMASVVGCALVTSTSRLPSARTRPRNSRAPRSQRLRGLLRTEVTRLRPGLRYPGAPEEVVECQVEQRAVKIEQHGFDPLPVRRAQSRRIHSVGYHRACGGIERMSLSAEQLSAWLPAVMQIADAAGREIMRIYESGF